MKFDKQLWKNKLGGALGLFEVFCLLFFGFLILIYFFIMHEFLMLRYFLRSSCENDKNRKENANEMKRTESNKKKKRISPP